METSKKCLIVLDGEINKSLLNNFINQNSPRNSFVFLAADGASNSLYKFKVIPDYIIGDLDSTSVRILNYFKDKGAKTKKMSEQQHNDFEKCVFFALNNNYKSISVVGFSGKRIDHTINNFSVMKKYSNKCQIKFIDNTFEIFFLDKYSTINYRKNESISLMAFPKAESITTLGLKYSLKNENLELGVREGALNKSTSKNIKIKFKKGSILIFKKHFEKLKSQ